jgi:hypothetical protein
MRICVCAHVYVVVVVVHEPVLDHFDLRLACAWPHLTRAWTKPPIEPTSRRVQVLAALGQTFCPATDSMGELLELGYDALLWTTAPA